MMWDLLIRSIQDWDARVFGPEDRAKGLVNHLKEEAIELNEAVHWGYHKKEISNELADVMILAFCICRSLNIDPYIAIANKFEAIQKRKYHPPDLLGVSRHIKE